jgi:methionyl-tRNA formyltransferase
LNDEAQIGVTLHDIASSIDDGAVIRQESVLNERHLSCHELYERAVNVGVELARWFVDQMARGSAPTGLAQNEKEASYYSPDYPHGFRIPWKQTLGYVVNYIRAAHFPPYPSAFGEIANKRLELSWPVAFSFERPGAARPGTVLVRHDGFWVSTLNGLVQPLRVIFEGKARDFGEVAIELGLAGQRFS